MPAKRALAAPRDVVYLYDGSLAGFFNCVYESVYQHELPAAIMPEQEAQPSLMLEKWIDSDPDRAARVRASIPRKISPRALALVESVFLSCMEKKEIRTLRFLLLGYAHGGRVMQMLGHPDVAPLLAAARHLGGECHLLKLYPVFGLRRDARRDHYAEKLCPAPPRGPFYRALSKRGFYHL